MKRPLNLTQTVFTILQNNEPSRDDYMLVVRGVHDAEMALYQIGKIGYYDAIFDNKLSDLQTIGRVWRKIQELRPELRGNKWDERQKQAGMVSDNVSKFLQLNLFEDMLPPKEI